MSQSAPSVAIPSVVVQHLTFDRYTSFRNHVCLSVSINKYLVRGLYRSAVKKVLAASNGPAVSSCESSTVCSVSCYDNFLPSVLGHVPFIAGRGTLRETQEMWIHYVAGGVKRLYYISRSSG